jgi:hypothetical protein
MMLRHLNLASESTPSTSPTQAQPEKEDLAVFPIVLSRYQIAHSASNHASAADPREMIYTALHAKNISIWQLKKRQRPAIAAQLDQLSPSEIHLRALDKNYCRDNLRHCLRNMIYQSPKEIRVANSADLEKLTYQLLELTLHEIENHQQKIHYYHGASSTIAFLYEFYTMLYYYLHGNPETHIFRMNNSVLKRLLNIAEFIDFFSKQRS